ncbi:hypothetical protein [Streptomyces nigra]
MYTDNPHRRIPGGTINSRPEYWQRENARREDLRGRILGFMREHREEQPFSLARIIDAFPNERQEDVKGCLRTLRHTRQVRQIGLVPDLWK